MKAVAARHETEPVENPLDALGSPQSVAASLVPIAAGFAAMFFADARAENAWTFAGCGLLVAGYVMLGYSIVMRRKPL